MGWRRSGAAEEEDGGGVVEKTDATKPHTKNGDAE
jgi:hypothetical protein